MTRFLSNDYFEEVRRQYNKRCALVLNDFLSKKREARLAIDLVNPVLLTYQAVVHYHARKPWVAINSCIGFETLVGSFACTYDIYFRGKRHRDYGYLSMQNRNRGRFDAVRYVHGSRVAWDRDARIIGITISREWSCRFLSIDCTYNYTYGG